jgi:hypothetical protein
MQRRPPGPKSDQGALYSILHYRYRMSKQTVYVDPRVQKVLDLYADILAGEFYSLPVKAQLEVQAARLTEALRKGDDAVCFQIGSWHPGLVGQNDDAILKQSFSMDDARATIAREFGFNDWNEVESASDRMSSLKFERAVNTMLSGNLSLLQVMVGESPELINETSQYGHNATLLHYAETNGVESYRQVVPQNLAEIVDFLIASGADPASKAGIYGASTPRQLFVSSKHSYESNVLKDLLAVFNRYDLGPIR